MFGLDVFFVFLHFSHKISLDLNIKNLGSKKNLQPVFMFGKIYHFSLKKRPEVLTADGFFVCHGTVARMEVEDEKQITTFKDDDLPNFRDSKWLKVRPKPKD